jgi:hypothetical protein
MGWQEMGKTWHDTDVEYCDVCGNLLIRRAWVFQDEAGETRRACREDDARLSATLRAYGARIEAAKRAFTAGQASPARKEGVDT